MGYVERPADAEEAPPAWRLLLTDRQTREFRVVLYPAMTGHALIMSALRGSLGLDPSLRRQLVDGLGPKGRAAYSVLTPKGTLFPDRIVPENDGDERWSAAIPDAVEALDAGAILERLHTLYAGEPPGVWRSVIDRPETWLAWLADGLRGVHDLMGQLWKDARPRLDIELARYEDAMSSGVAPLLWCNNLASDLTMTPSELRVAFSTEMFVRYPGELLFAPMAVPGRGLNVAAGERGAAIIGYGMAGPTWSSAGAEPEDGRLPALLGVTRAHALLLLDRPRTMGDLAVRVSCAPSTLTAHVTKLVAAGLVGKVQIGKRVWMYRTEEGNRIVDLLGPGR